MQKILVTGFEPFGGEPINPSLETIKALAAWQPDGVHLVLATLPTSARAVQAALREAVVQHRPDAVISVGQAGSRPEVSVERVGINVLDMRIPDNAGVQLVDEPVVPGGPAAYFASVPIKAIAARLREGGVPAHVSQTAGTFICNAVLYGACHLAATEFPGIRAGFLHVPYLPEQAARNPGAPSMALETIVRAVRIAVETVRDTASDLRVAEGATH